MNKIINITQEAMDAMTEPQLHAISRLVHPEAVASIDVYQGGFGLPDGYLSFAYHYAGGGSIYGGIDSEGAVST